MIGLALTAPRSRFLIAATIAAAVCCVSFALDRATAQTAADYAPLLAAADRSDADRDADKRRDPTPFLVFAAPRPGMKVLDMGAGGGYSSELMARAVAPNGVVFAQNPADLGERAKAAFQALRRRGLSKEEAKRQIERVFDASFRRILLSEIKDTRRTDPRPECWLLLAEGIPVERIFPDLVELGLGAEHRVQ